MVESHGRFSFPEHDREMNCREARYWKRCILESNPQLDVEVWAIAQGLARLRVKGPTTRGIVDLTIRSPRDAAILCT